MTVHDAESFLAAVVARNDGPALLFDCFLDRRIGGEHMAAIVAAVWSAAEFPQRSLTVDLWCMFFRMADYPKPDGPITLYRGATRGRARGMSWTTNLDRAGWFADRFGKFSPEADAEERAIAASLGIIEPPSKLVHSDFRPAYVYTVEAPPEAVLAVMDEVNPNGRGEHEVVVDPRLLPRVRRLAP